MAKRLKTMFNKPRPHRFDVFIKSLQNLGRISTTVEQRMFYILVKRKAKEYRSNRVKINPQNGTQPFCVCLFFVCISADGL